ncbi:MAG TPA: (deoxy)nucleoside triphosphate pyrophosphohydrolase, partial [Archangium sp.]
MTQGAPKRTVRVVAALIAKPGDDSRFLVQQRLPGGSRGLLW